MQTISGGLFHAMNQAQATYYEAYYLSLMCTIIAHCLLHKQVAMQEQSVARKQMLQEEDNWDHP